MNWYYDLGGQRQGPVPAPEALEIIRETATALAESISTATAQAGRTATQQAGATSAAPTAMPTIALSLIGAPMNLRLWGRRLWLPWVICVPLMWILMRGGDIATKVGELIAS